MIQTPFCFPIVRNLKGAIHDDPIYATPIITTFDLPYPFDF
jgi:hypothetical protein